MLQVTEARFKWRGRWWGNTRYGSLLGHPVELLVRSGPAFVGSGPVTAILPAHNGYPHLSHTIYGGGRQAAVELARQLLIRRLKKGRP